MKVRPLTRQGQGVVEHQLNKHLPHLCPQTADGWRLYAAHAVHLLPLSCLQAWADGGPSPGFVLHQAVPQAASRLPCHARSAARRYRARSRAGAGSCSLLLTFQAALVPGQAAQVKLCSLAGDSR